MSRIDRNQKPKLIKYGNVPQAVDEGLDKGFLEVGVRVVTQAKALVPVEFGVLGASIMLSSPLDPEYGLGVAPEKNGGGKGGGGDAPKISQVAGKHEAYVGTAVEYGIYQEFGTRKMPAQPFLRPAIQIVTGHGRAKEIIAKYNSEEVRFAVMRAAKEEAI